MSQPGFQGNSYLLDINADSGAFVSVLAKSTVRRLVVEESPLTAEGGPNALQGSIQYKIPNDDTVAGFTTIFEALGANDETAEGEIVVAKIELGNPVAQIGGMGEVIGQLGQPFPGLVTPAAATTMIQLRSGTGTGTTVKVTEYN